MKFPSILTSETSYEENSEVESLEPEGVVSFEN